MKLRENMVNILPGPFELFEVLVTFELSRVIPIHVVHGHEGRSLTEILDGNAETVPIVLPVFVMRLGAPLDDHAIDRHAAGETDLSDDALLLPVGVHGACLLQPGFGIPVLPVGEVGSFRVNHLRAA